MTVSFVLPAELEQSLRGEFADVDLAAKESFLVDLYRSRRLSHRQLAEALGLDRFETEAVLRRHHVTEDLPTAADLAADDAALDRVLGPARR